MRKEPGGRPLRFFAMLAIGWVTVRLAIQPWAVDGAPSASPILAVAGVAPAAAALLVEPDTAPKPTSSVLAQMRAPGSPSGDKKDDVIVELIHFSGVADDLANRQYGGVSETEPPVEGIAPAPVQPMPLPLLSPPHRPAANRWRASAWILWRPDGSGGDIARLGRLGGSQAGIRIDREIAAPGSARIAPYARATAALQRPPAPEAALGLALQPNRAVPLVVAVERRAAIGDGGRNANVAYVAGGFGPSAPAAGLQTSGYVQTGIVGFRQRDLFIDGKFSLLAPVARQSVRIGASLSGGAQPGIHRVDIGPEAQIRLALPETTARLSVEWRERIAGRAAPSSGLAVTLAADF